MYHGKEKWKLKTVSELIEDLPGEIIEYIPKFKTDFIDLADFSDNQLEAFGNSLITSVLLLQKYATKQQELENKLNLIYNKLDSVSDRNLMRLIIVYSLQIVEINIVKKVIMNISPNIKKEVMTAYDTLIQQGIEQGIEQGAWQNKIEIIVKGYKKGLSTDFLADIAGLDIKQVEEIIAKHSDRYN